MINNENMHSNFTEIDEEFVCFNCSNKVEKLGYTSRDHCNVCLYSKHVDVNPGDRAENCHGNLIPIKVELNAKKGNVIVYRCSKCQTIRKNKAANDDNIDLIIKLTAEEVIY